jgi:hypothetical protein
MATIITATITALSTDWIPEGYRLAVTDADLLNLPDTCPLCGHSRIVEVSENGAADVDSCDCPPVVEDSDYDPRPTHPAVSRGYDTIDEWMSDGWDLTSVDAMGWTLAA